jgi:HK97 gp10 family phage protein
MAKLEFTLLDAQATGLAIAIAETMRKSGYAPVETGKLRKSIRTLPVVDTKNGIQAPIGYIGYGIYPDLGTKYQRAQKFTERAQEDMLAQQSQALATSAGQDIANFIDDVLPSTITINLDL